MMRSRRSPWQSAGSGLVLAALLLAALALEGVVNSAAGVDRKARAIAAAKPEVLSLKDALMHDPGSPIVGNPDGDVTIVAFVDYNCPY